MYNSKKELNEYVKKVHARYNELVNVERVHKRKVKKISNVKNAKK